MATYKAESWTPNKDIAKRLATLEKKVVRRMSGVIKVKENWRTLDFKLSPCFEYCMYSFGYFPGVRLWFADVSEPSQFHLQGMDVEYTLHPALEDGTDRGFRNVGKPQSDVGEIPKRIHTKLEKAI